MDKDFIKKATRITSLTISPRDFQSLKYKKEIQLLFKMVFFPKFDLSKTVNTVDMGRINKLIVDLKTGPNASSFTNIHNYKLEGVGPGEATLFFLINNAYLGGGSSAGVDLFVDSKKYEIKAARISPDKVASNFRIGKAVPLHDIMTMLYDLQKTLKLGNAIEIPTSVINQMKVKDLASFKKIELAYATTAYNHYFKDHEVIFINNAVNKLGLIEAVKKINIKDIMIERVTGGTIKPKIQL